MSRNDREAIGKAWLLFFFLVFHSNRSNKYMTNYAELAEKLKESPNTIKHWKGQLVVNKVIRVLKGKYSMTFIFLPPYDSLVTCEQDDWVGARLKSDPKVRKVLDKITENDNMSLLPLIVELSTKIDKLEQKAELL